MLKRIRPHGSRLAHMYGLPKLHKPGIPLRPVLSATGTYNFELAKWLNSVLQPLVYSKHTVESAFEFVDILKEVPVSKTMVSFDVVSLFTNVPLSDTIEIILDELFDSTGQSEYLAELNCETSRSDTKKLLELATSGMLFTFDGDLYEQFDGVSMGSPLGPLFANFFLGYLEKTIFSENLEFLPLFYIRYVDDTFLLFSCDSHVEKFLSKLNNFHPAIDFTCEYSVDKSIPFIGVDVTMTADGFTTSVYHKTCDKGLFVHRKSFCDEKYKRNLMPMLCHRAFALSSSWTGFHREVERSITCLRRLGYDPGLLSKQIRNFLDQKMANVEQKTTQKDLKSDVPFIVLPYRGEIAKKCLNLSLKDLCKRTNILFPKVVMTSTKLISILRRPESKPSLVNNGCVSYIFNCPEAGCESRYVGITSRHLHQRVMEHLMKRKESPSAIYEHLVMHGKKPLFSEHFGCFKVLKKSSSWRFLLFSEAFSIKSLKCDLNRQSDSITLAVF